MSRTKQEITDAFVELYQDLCALNGQGVDRPAPRLIAQVVRMLEPQRGGLLLAQAKIKLRSTPKPTKPEVPEAVLPEVGKPKGAQQVRQSQPHKAEPEQPQQVAPKLEGETEGESVAAVEPLTVDEIAAMLELKPIDAEENYPAARVIAALVSAGFPPSTLQGKTYRQLYNITRSHFA